MKTFTLDNTALYTSFPADCPFRSGYHLNNEDYKILYFECKYPGKSSDYPECDSDKIFPKCCPLKEI